MSKAGETAGQRFAKRMRQERQRRGWRQEDLALWAAGEGLTLHATGFSKIENGQRPVSLDEAAAIAAAFGIPLSQMLTSPDPGELARELEETQAALTQAQADSDDATHRVVALWNRAEELKVALDQERGGYSLPGD